MSFRMPRQHICAHFSLGIECSDLGGFNDEEVFFSISSNFNDSCFKLCTVKRKDQRHGNEPDQRNAGPKCVGSDHAITAFGRN